MILGLSQGGSKVRIHIEEKSTNIEKKENLDLSYVSSSILINLILGFQNSDFVYNQINEYLDGISDLSYDLSIRQIITNKITIRAAWWIQGVPFRGFKMRCASGFETYSLVKTVDSVERRGFDVGLRGFEVGAQIVDSRSVL